MDSRFEMCFYIEEQDERAGQPTPQTDENHRGINHLHNTEEEAQQTINYWEKWFEEFSQRTGRPNHNKGTLVTYVGFNGKIGIAYKHTCGRCGKEYSDLIPNGEDAVRRCEDCQKLDKQESEKYHAREQAKSESRVWLAEHLDDH